MSNGSSLDAFRFEDSGQSWDVRWVGTIDNPEWVANDVVAVLYPEANPKDRTTYLGGVPAEWKGRQKVPTLGGEQNMTTLFEAGLYCLIARSNSPIAVPFQKWVYEEVLPSIRKTGNYSITQRQSLALAPTQRDKLENIRLGMDLLYELGGIDERTQLALKDIVRDALLEDKLKKPSGSSGRFEWPVSDRASHLGYKPKRADLIRIGKTVASLYRLRHGENPPAREQFVDGTTRSVKCYGESDLDILDQAIVIVMETPKQLPEGQD